MAKVRFEHLYLSSSEERRALSVPLDAPKVVIEGGNGFGKSAIIKSLYQTLGATPQKVDRRWTQANVSSCLFFRLDDRPLAAVRTLGTHALFDRDTNQVLFTGRRLVADWGPRLAELFGFRLTMSDYQGEIITPPPAYMFAPFYVDQDKGWNKAWDSFADFRAVPNTAKTLVDLHSGLRPNEFSAARAEVQRDQLTLKAMEAGIAGLRESIASLEGVKVADAPTLDLSVFAAETARLVQRSESLLSRQKAHRRSMLELHEEGHLVRAERNLLKGALSEMRGEFAHAINIVGDIECPTCGVVYENSLADRFGLIKDEQVLIQAIATADVRLEALGAREGVTRRDLAEVEAALSEVQAVLQAERASVTLNDVVVAAGRTEAVRVLGEGLDQKILEARAVSDRVDQHRATMEKFKDRRRSAEIKARFHALFSTYAARLDVALEDGQKSSLASPNVARGSEGPRALLAYYYAFLHINAEYAGGVRAPIVIDAPNQQGQDGTHLPEMLNFILSEAPAGSQVIVAVEDVGAIDRTGLNVRNYANKKRQILRDDAYDTVAALLRPYQDAILAATAGPEASTSSSNGDGGDERLL